MLVVVCGLPGVGKSTVAELVADRVDGARIRTDVVRKDLLEDPSYSQAERYRVYEALFDRARDRLADGEDVVLDGTFRERTLRRRAADLADEQGVAFRLLKVECDEAVVTDRIADREDDPSDADAAVHAQFRETFDPVTMTHTTVDNSGDLEHTAEQVAECL